MGLGAIQGPVFMPSTPPSSAPFQPPSPPLDAVSAYRNGPPPCAENRDKSRRKRMKIDTNDVNHAVTGILTRDTGPGSVPAPCYAPEAAIKVAVNAANHAVTDILTRDIMSASAPASRVRVMGWYGGEEGEGEGEGCGGWNGELERGIEGRIALRSGIDCEFWRCQDT